ncbi:uncharacterized protein SNRPG isoform X1 [Panulirus ornatus]|uniref:uncharacterized protein SNRPG isoform X1 n=1 Tax=Panulirus ornatus TaxID=150431 RepID=UPI003A87897E
MSKARNPCDTAKNYTFPEAYGGKKRNIRSSKVTKCPDIDRELVKKLADIIISHQGGGGVGCGRGRRPGKDAAQSLVMTRPSRPAVSAPAAAAAVESSTLSSRKILRQKDVAGVARPLPLVGKTPQQLSKSFQSRSLPEPQPAPVQAFKKTPTRHLTPSDTAVQRGSEDDSKGALHATSAAAYSSRRRSRRRCITSAASDYDFTPYMDKRVMTKLNGGRVVEGTLRGFDPFMNLVVDDGVEVRKTGDRVRIGVVVIRGSSIIMLESLDRIS